MERILLCVNSDIGRGNTIGFRFTKVAEALSASGRPYDLIARGSRAPHLTVRTPLLGAFVGRALNAARIYLFPSWDSHSWDVWLFDRFVLRRLRRASASYTLAHVGEFLPRSIAWLKAHGATVFLDVPMGHDAYRLALEARGIRVGSEALGTPAYVDQALSRADVLIVPSAFVKETLERAGFSGKRIVVVPFGADAPAAFSREDIAKRLEHPKPFRFLFAGNVNYRKGVFYLLRAWKKANLSNAELVLCGRVYKEIAGEVSAAQSRALGSGSASGESAGPVRVLGFQQNIASQYAQAHVFVFPTLLEGSAKAVYEAMRYGLPVITTANAGSIVEDGKSGFLVPIADPDALCERMRFLYEHADAVRDMGGRAMEAVSAYTWERYAHRVLDVYESRVLAS